jgi:Tfp pilus assembly protein PilF
MKRNKEAKKFFEKALAIDPKSASARFNLAMTCLAMNQRDCAREQYAILKHDEPDLSTKLFQRLYSSKILSLVK